MTALVGDVESVKAAIADVCASAVFGDQLAVVNAEKNDGHTTPGLAVIYSYERMTPETYPCLEIIGLNGTYTPEDDVKEVTHRIALVFTVVGDNEQTVTSDVERLVRTARDVFWRSVLGGLVGLEPMHVETEDYSELIKPNDGPFIKGGKLILAAATLAN
jgi:hypothetical protein